jgi:hypothetical protein
MLVKYWGWGWGWGERKPVSLPLGRNRASRDCEKLRNMSDYSVCGPRFVLNSTGRAIKLYRCGLMWVVLEKLQYHESCS